MVRDVLLIIVCLCLMFGMEVKSYAGPRMNPDLMQNHIEKVKRTSPGKYQSMVQRAGGNITDCCSCHKEIAYQKGKNKFGVRP
jgi:hypothetical protein